MNTTEPSTPTRPTTEQLLGLIARLPEQDRQHFRARLGEIQAALAAEPSHAGWLDEEHFLLTDLEEAIQE